MLGKTSPVYQDFRGNEANRDQREAKACEAVQEINADPKMLLSFFHHEKLKL